MTSNRKKIISCLAIVLIFGSGIGFAFRASAMADTDNSGAAAIAAGNGTQGCTGAKAQFDLGSASLDANLDSPDIANDETPLGTWFYLTKPQVTIQVSAPTCIGSTVKVSLLVYHALTSDTPVPALNEKSFIVPSSGQFQIQMAAGEDGCSGVVANVTSAALLPTCLYDLEVYDAATGNQLDYSSRETRGYLGYNLNALTNATTDDLWRYISDTSGNAITTNTNPVTLTTTGSTDSCTSDTTGTCYQLYGGLSDIFGALGTNLTSFTQTTSLGAFLNAVIAIIIGIAGVIAVVRIMYLGVVYMKSDNVTNKLTVRGAIIQTVGGFILLLLIYTILRTINPDLLNLTPSFSTVKVTVIPPSTTQPSPTGTDTSGADTATSVTNIYIPARDQQLPNAPLGLKVLITAHTLMEGFSPKTVTYVTNNPGNIGTQINNPNVQLSSVTCPSGLSSYQIYSGNGNNWGCYPTLAQGIQGQANLATKAASGTVSPYKVGGSNGYDGSLAEYLNLYEHGTITADTNSTNYLNYFIKFFAQNGITVTGKTPLSQIVNGTSSS